MCFLHLFSYLSVRLSMYSFIFNIYMAQKNHTQNTRQNVHTANLSKKKERSFHGQPTIHFPGFLITGLSELDKARCRRPCHASPAPGTGSAPSFRSSERGPSCDPIRCPHQRGHGDTAVSRLVKGLNSSSSESQTVLENVEKWEKARLLMRV